MVTPDKWSKARAYMSQLLEIASTTNLFDSKQLDSIRGYLIYVVHTYPSFTPYLKGLHLTINSWCLGRLSDGWKDMGSYELELSLADQHPPQEVRGVPRLLPDLQALSTLFQPSIPPRQVVRGSTVAVVLYGYANASRSGSGSCFATPQGLRIRYGLWGRVISHQSSNFQELQNLADTVEWELVDQFPVLREAVAAIDHLASAELSPGLELFLFTDNIVAESAFFRGTSSNPLLFDLILRLKQLELQYSLHLYVAHIAGTRMMAQGTDGLSHGAAWEFNNPVTIVPLHLSPVDRDPTLLTWVASWIPAGLSPHILTPYEWYTTGHGVMESNTNLDGMCCPSPAPYSTVFVWHPAPTAAEAALEELCFSRHKRPTYWHIFLCPRLFTHTWRKRLFKFSEVTFYLTPGFLPVTWPATQHEPIVVGIFLPLLGRPPWLAKVSPPLLPP